MQPDFDSLVFCKIPSAAESGLGPVWDWSKIRVGPIKDWTTARSFLVSSQSRSRLILSPLAHQASRQPSLVTQLIAHTSKGSPPLSHTHTSFLSCAPPQPTSLSLANPSSLSHAHSSSLSHSTTLSHSKSPSLSHTPALLHAHLSSLLHAPQCSLSLLALSLAGTPAFSHTPTL